MLLVIGALVGIAAFLLAETATGERRERRASLRRVKEYEGLAGRTPAPRRRALVGAEVEKRLAALSQRLTPRTSTEKIAEQLASAGLAGKVSVRSFLALRAASAITSALVATLFATAAGVSFAVTLLLLVCFAAAGFVLPGAIAGIRRRQRAEQIRRELPDALDILAVSVEAGLALDAAVAKLVEGTSGPLSEEFALVVREVRVGESRQAALERMAQRLGIPEVTTFVRALVQGDRLGTSLGSTLKVQAREARRRRSVAAEEKAGKAPVKMLFPTAIFIFPALFVVILGPAVLTIGQLLSS